MPSPRDYDPDPPTRGEIDALPGATLVEFGTGWCGYCRAAEPHVREALGDHPDVPHLKVEDGPGRKLGRSFGVKLWPTLVFLRDGQEVARLVRPTSAQPIRDALQQVTQPAALG